MAEETVRGVRRDGSGMSKGTDAGPSWPDSRDPRLEQGDGKGSGGMFAVVGKKHKGAVPRLFG